MSRPQNRKAVKMALDAMMKVFGVHLNPDIVEIIFDNLVNIYKVLTMKPFKMRTSWTNKKLRKEIKISHATFSI